jgi:DNA ligase-1
MFAQLAAVSQRVAATSARLDKVRDLASFLRSLPAEEIEIAALYLAGETPQGRIGIGATMLRAAASTTAANQQTLSIREVDRRLAALAGIHGAGAAGRRAEALCGLFAFATFDEQGFLLRLLLGELRQGAMGGVMVDAIAAAAKVPVAKVRRASMYSRNLGVIARVVLLQGADALDQIQFELFSPVAPMLAQTAADVAEALRELHGEVVFEWKLDGARIQVHKAADEVRVYTRTMNEVTGALPEIVEVVRTLSARELVLDGEAIAFDTSERPLPFQVTMRRFGRKIDIAGLRAELPIRAFFFDCLYVEGHSITERTTRERYQTLARVVPSWLRIPSLLTSSEPAARAFYEAALASGHEGVMAKSLDARYEAGNRGAAWLKIKRAHSLDLVVLAAEWGHGRRTGYLSNLHLGALEPTSGEYVMLGKTFKGLTDVMLERQTKQFLAHETHRDQSTVYLRPEVVVEIAFSDLQASPRYPGGLALRLARVKRYRDDKRAEDADTMEAVRRIFAAQAAAPLGPMK